MLLQKLAEHAETLSLPPLLYQSERIRYVIDLHLDGSPLSGQPVDTSYTEPTKRRDGSPGKPRVIDGIDRTVPHIQRSSAIKPRVLADNAHYTLGYDGEDPSEARTAAAYRAYLDSLARCAEATGEPAVAAVLHFLSGKPLDALTLPDDFGPRARIVFRIHTDDGTVFPHDLASVRSWWAAEHVPGGVEGTCQICGEHKALSTRMDLKIERVPGAQARASLISANWEAFVSYGQEASQMASLCQTCASRSHHALNHLLNTEQSHIRFADSAIAFWADDADDAALFTSVLTTGGETDADIRAFLRRVWRTETTDVPDIDVGRFYALTLAGNSGRVALQDWIDVPLPQAQRNLAKWFAGMEIAGPAYQGEPARMFFGLWTLAAATERDAKDVPAPLVRQLVRSALRGDPLPAGVLASVIRRIRAEQAITRVQAALLRLVITSQGGDMTTELNSASTDPPYLCGRLLSELDTLQRQASGWTLETSIRDRFYGSASTTPATVFGRLLRGAMPHLDKLERDNPSAGHGVATRIAEIMEPLGDFPATLTVREQARFGLGFWHQEMHRKRAIAAAKAARAEDDNPAEEANR